MSGSSRSSSPGGSAPPAPRCGRRCACSASRGWWSTCPGAACASRSCRPATSTSSSPCATPSSSSPSGCAAAHPADETGLDRDGRRRRGDGVRHGRRRHRGPGRRAPGVPPGVGSALGAPAPIDVYEPVILKLQLYMATNLRREADAAPERGGPAAAPHGSTKRCAAATWPRSSTSCPATEPAPTSLPSWTGSERNTALTARGFRCHQTVDNRRNADFGSRRLPDLDPARGLRGRALGARRRRRRPRTPRGRRRRRLDLALQRRGIARPRRRDRGALGARRPTAALRGAVRREGQHRRRGLADHRGLPRVQLLPRRRRHERAPAPRTGRDRRREDEPRPVRHRPQRHPQPVRRPGERLRRRPHLGRVELGQRRRRGRRASSRSRWAPTPPDPGGCPPR